MNNLLRGAHYLDLLGPFFLPELWIPLGEILEKRFHDAD